MECNIFQHLDQKNFEGLHDQECTHTNDIVPMIVTTGHECRDLWLQLNIVWSYIDIEVLTCFTSKVFEVKRKIKFF